MEAMEKRQEAVELFEKAAASAQACLPASDPLAAYVQDNLERLTQSDSLQPKRQ